MKWQRHGKKQRGVRWCRRVSRFRSSCWSHFEQTYVDDYYCWRFLAEIVIAYKRRQMIFAYEYLPTGRHVILFWYTVRATSQPWHDDCYEWKQQTFTVLLSCLIGLTFEHNFLENFGYAYHFEDIVSNILIAYLYLPLFNHHKQYRSGRFITQLQYLPKRTFSVL